MAKLSFMEEYMYKALYSRIMHLNDGQNPGREHVVLLLAIASPFGQREIVREAIKDAVTSADGTLTEQQFLQMIQSLVCRLPSWERLALLHIALEQQEIHLTTSSSTA